MRVLSVDAVHPDARAISEAADVLRSGRVVVFPTETVYGLGALALDPEAVKRVYAVKGRPPTHPLIVHVLDEDAAKKHAAEWPALAEALARAFWPGPLTLVVPKGKDLPLAVTGGGDAVALRVPSHAVARALLAAVGEAIVAPSANQYQSLSPTRAEHVVAQLEGQELLILDGGPCPSGIESTVVDVRGAEPRVLRPGALTIEALRAVVPSLQFTRSAIKDDRAVRAAPGQGTRHYAPKAALVLARDRRAALALATERVAAGESIALVLFGESRRRDEPDPGTAIHVLPRTPAGAGAALYALLYELDAKNAARIVVEEPPNEPGWEAVADRLRRAAALPGEIL